MTTDVLFYISSVVALIGGIIVLFSRNTVNSAMGLLLTFLATAGIYLSLYSPFLAMAQVFLYSGAVAVMIVFAIMLIDEGKKYELPIQGLFTKSLAVVSILYICFLLINFLKFTGDARVAKSDVMDLGRIILSDYILHLEALSIMLIISIMSAILIAKRKG